MALFSEDQYKLVRLEEFAFNSPNELHGLVDLMPLCDAERRCWMKRMSGLSAHIMQRLSTRTDAEAFAAIRHMAQGGKKEVREQAKELLAKMLSNVLSQ